jgi:hypothetical protein
MRQLAIAASCFEKLPSEYHTAYKPRPSLDIRHRHGFVRNGGNGAWGDLGYEANSAKRFRQSLHPAPVEAARNRLREKVAALQPARSA